MTFIEEEFEGLYGRYRITNSDRLEVENYRKSLLSCGISFLSGILHWLLIGPEYAWAWLMPICVGLGLALKWIHIYLKPLHLMLQVLWAAGCLGTLLLVYFTGANQMLSKLVENPSLLWLIGPLFTALTGVGFKEFFCFQRIEAIGLTCLVPLALIGHLTGLLNNFIVLIALFLAAISLLTLSIRKFGMSIAADIGDKSVFNYLREKNTAISA